MAQVSRNSQAIFASYFDGYSAVPRRVELRSETHALSILPTEAAPILWPYTEIHQLPDQASREGVVLMKGTGQARLCIESQHEDLVVALRAACPPKSAVPLTGETRKRLLGFSFLAVGSIILILFFFLPLLAVQLVRILPPEAEKALGDATFQQIRVAMEQGSDEGLHICDGRPGQEALAALKARLVKHTMLPFPVSLHVLDSDLVNAFTLPGGHVVLFRGLIDAAEDPNEIAAVLAHELGHVFYRDGTVGALRSVGSIGVLGLLFGDFAGGSVALVSAEQFIHAQHSQAVERRADAFATDLMTKAQIDPRALAAFFQRLEKLHGSEAGLVIHFKSHPELKERMMKALRAQVPTGARAALSPDEWANLLGICR